MFYATTISAAVLVMVAMTSFGSSAKIKDELVDLLQRLREDLEKEDTAVDARSKYRSRHDDFKVVRYHGMKMEGSRVKASRSSGPGLTSSQASDLVDAINRARRNEGATDMYHIRWNDELASIAQQWSDQCQFRHGTPLFEGSEVGFFDVGQNNFAFTGNFNAAAVVADWMSEKSSYNFATDACTGKSCDRYKQLVWSYTTDVGCGMTGCDSIAGIGNGNFLVCYFGPPGVYYGELPYAPGAAPCTQCSLGQFYCNNGLCDATCSATGATCQCAASCKNCGTATSECRCQCNKGSVGVDCSKTCRDYKTECGRDWPKDFCSYDAFDWVRKECPKMCKLCETADPCASSQSGQGQGQTGQSPAPAPAPVNPQGSQASTSTTGDAPIDPSLNLARGLTDAQKRRVITLHNKYRSRESASNMNMLVWNDQLARIAQEWSDKCVFEHRALGIPGGHGYVDPTSVGFPTGSLGENIWAFSDNSQFVPDKAIDDWWNEKSDYTFSTKTCAPGKICGHYIAVAWAQTVAVGCGFTKCSSVQVGSATWPGGVFLSCNYAPGADPNKQPFLLGSPCTECSSGRMFCTNSLCDNSCQAAGSPGKCECMANCVHGSLDRNSCSCKCNAGYMGGQCDETCEDRDPQCGTKWPELFCDKDFLTSINQVTFYDLIVSSCPKLCGQCVAAKRTSHLLDSYHHRLFEADDD